MKKALIILFVGLIISFLFALVVNDALFNYDFMTIFGFGNLCLSVLGVLSGFILFIVKQKENGIQFFIASGLLLVLGMGIYLLFPLRFDNLIM